MPNQQVPARYIKRGDIIRYDATNPELTEVVRDVQVVLMLANGNNLPVAPSQPFEIIPPEDVPIPPEEVS